MLWPRFLLSTTPLMSRLSHMATSGRATTARFRRPQSPSPVRSPARFIAWRIFVIGHQPEGGRGQVLRGNVDRPKPTFSRVPNLIFLKATVCQLTSTSP